MRMSTCTQESAPSLARLLHAQFGLDHYPNYLLRVRISSCSLRFFFLAIWLCGSVVWQGMESRAWFYVAVARG